MKESRSTMVGSADADFLTGGGEMGRLIRQHAWSSTQLGCPQQWPTQLKTLISIMLSANQPMFLVWGADRMMIYNDAYSEILATKHPYALGRDFLEVWKEIRDDLDPIVDQAYSGSPVHMDDIELVLNRRGYPEETHFSFSYTPIRGDDGRILGFFCPLNETTAQVLAERRLRESEARAKGVLDGMVEGFLLLDPEYRILDVNSEFEHHMQKSREELLGTNYFTSYPEHEGTELAAFYRRAMEDREAGSLQHACLKPTQETWLETRVYPVDEGLAVFFRDITEQKQSEAAARETDERYRLAVRATNDAIWDWHFATNYVLWNEALETAYGHKLDEVEPTGEWWLEQIHPDDRQRIHDSIHAAIDGTAESWSDEYRFARADGTFAEVFDRGHVIRDEQGRATRMIGAMLDLTEQRRSQIALRKSEERYPDLVQLHGLGLLRGRGRSV